jgi:hypothetical protein
MRVSQQPMPTPEVVRAPGESGVAPELCRNSSHAAMSEVGQKRRFDNRPVTSGLPPTSDIADSASHVGFVPTRDSCTAAILIAYSITSPAPTERGESRD